MIERSRMGDGSQTELDLPKSAKIQDRGSPSLKSLNREIPEELLNRNA